MKTKNNISTAAFLAAASLSFSSSVWSLGLGDVEVESYLNQPLQLRIDLLTRETDDLSAVTAQLASADDYALIGASADDIPVPIRFTVEDREGDTYLLATSNLPIANPVVRLIVQVNHSSGRLLREYTIFLDPATQASQAPIPRVDLRSEPAPGPVTKPADPPPSATDADSPEPATASPDAPATGSTPAPRQVPAEGEYGPVSSGETLWAIASDWSRGTGMDINKVMIAIQRENPEAFMRGNINLLKRGAILRMPAVASVQNISTAAAISEVSEQTDDFQGRRSTDTAASPSTPLVAEETSSYNLPEPADDAAEMELDQELIDESVDSLAEAQVEEPIETSIDPVETAAEDLPVTDQLELVPPSADSELDSAPGFEESDDQMSDAAVAATALREDLARTEEDLITQQQQNEYLEQRIQELESQLAEAEEGDVEDANLAAMEDRLRQQREQEAARQSSQESWFSRYSTWLIGLLVLVAAGAGWLLSRRGRADEFAAEAGTEEVALQEIKDEAEEVLRVLEDPDEGTSVSAAKDDADDASEEAAAEEQADVKAEKPTAPKSSEGSSDDAELLDEESSDPEIQLDLARAYISMGDKEAARVILEEVSSNGNEAQREEAAKMLNLLVS